MLRSRKRCQYEFLHLLRLTHRQIIQAVSAGRQERLTLTFPILVATNDIVEGDDLFTISRNLVLSVKNSTLSKHLGEQLEELGPWLSLMVVMIYEYLLGENSKWYSYFKILPSSFDTLMFWDERQLSELQASAILGKIGKESADRSILDSVAPLIRSNPSLFPPIDGLTSWDDETGTSTLLQLAHRMGSLIMAYAFDIDKTEGEESPDEDGFIPDEEEQPSKGMVPLADLLNADADRNNVRFWLHTSTPVLADTHLLTTLRLFCFKRSPSLS